jgi:hypothetical protein
VCAAGEFRYQGYLLELQGQPPRGREDGVSISVCNLHSAHRISCGACADYRADDGIDGAEQSKKQTRFVAQRLGTDSEWLLTKP